MYSYEIKNLEILKKFDKNNQFEFFLSFLRKQESSLCFVWTTFTCPVKKYKFIYLFSNYIFYKSFDIVII